MIIGHNSRFFNNSPKNITPLIRLSAYSAHDSQLPSKFIIDPLRVIGRKQQAAYGSQRVRYSFPILHLPVIARSTSPLQ